MAFATDWRDDAACLGDPEPDDWFATPAERERLERAMAVLGVTDFVRLGGDFHFRDSGIGQEFQPGRRLQKGDRPGKELPGRLVEVRFGFAHLAGSGVSGTAFIPG